jgi:hypothetical protein
MVLDKSFLVTTLVIASAVREAIPDERIGDCFAAARLAMTGGLRSNPYIRSGEIACFGFAQHRTKRLLAMTRDQ